jgi:hypothetical protein
MYDEMLQQMPENHLTLVDEILTGETPDTSTAPSNSNLNLFDDTQPSNSTFMLDNWQKSTNPSLASQSLLFSPIKSRKLAKNRLEKLLDDEEDDEDTSTRSIDSETESISDLPDFIDDDDPDDPEYQVPVKHSRI